jgi:hypothetical protein
MFGWSRPESMKISAGESRGRAPRHPQPGMRIPTEPGEKTYLAMVMATNFEEVAT